MKIDRVKTENNAKLLKALSHPARLCIVHNLCENGPQNVTSLVDCMGMSQTTVSQHLAKLRDLQIVSVKRQGNNSFYEVSNETVRAILKVMF